jgi:hypothetical protein
LSSGNSGENPLAYLVKFYQFKAAIYELLHWQRMQSLFYKGAACLMNLSFGIV